jgi:hypothetical protein
MPAVSFEPAAVIKAWKSMRNEFCDWPERTAGSLSGTGLSGTGLSGTGLSGAGLRGAGGRGRAKGRLDILLQCRCSALYTARAARRHGIEQLREVIQERAAGLVGCAAGVITRGRGSMNRSKMELFEFEVSADRSIWRSPNFCEVSRARCRFNRRVTMDRHGTSY